MSRARSRATSAQTAAAGARALPRVLAGLGACACACAAAAGALSCAAPRGGGTDPRAIVVAPATGAPAAGGVSEPPAQSADEVAPFELALDAQRVCARLQGHVHCTDDLAPETTLGALPALEGIDSAVSLALGRGFGCAATRAGTVLCFGDNEYGQLGAGLRTNRSDKPVEVAGLRGAKRVIAGDAHACALLRDGGVRCWGRNDHGQTGGSTFYAPAAHELVAVDAVEHVKDVVDLAARATTTCAVDKGHAVTCWGRGVLGDEDTSRGASKNVKPTSVAELAGLDTIGGSETAFCGTRQGEVHCWGETWSLVAGSRYGSAALVPVSVPRARRVRVARNHACAVLADGAVWCWGTNYYGALGTGETSSFDALPAGVVKGLPFAVDVVVGGSMSCAVTGSRDVYCWGAWPHAGHEPRREPSPVKLRLAE